MYSMQATKRQQQVLEFIKSHQEANGLAPSLREIARHFRFRSVTAAADHIRALIGKGVMKHQPDSRPFLAGRFSIRGTAENRDRRSGVRYDPRRFF